MGIKFDLEKQMSFLKEDIVKTNAHGNEIVFIETRDSGYAELKVKTDKYSIFIDNADKLSIPFMKDEVCADSILIQKNAEGQWSLRIFEFKKTLNLEKLVHVRTQIKNAIFKALMLKGCLDIEDFSEIKGYCGFRFNDVEGDKKRNPQLLKKTHIAKAYNEWVAFKFIIKDMNIEISLEGITLDASSGHGEIQV